jgi:hypothetical protein
MRIGKRGAKFMRLFHIVTASIWFGSVVCLFAVMCTCFFDMDATAFTTVAPYVDAMFDYVALPAALLTVAQGVVYGIAGWGFVRHRWVLLKWIAVAALVVLTGEGTISQMSAALVAAKVGGFVGGFTDGAGALAFTAAQIVVMIAVFALSVYKPALRKGKTATGE